MKKYDFVISCVDVPREEVDDLHAMIEAGRPIEYGTFCRYVDIGKVADLFGCYSRRKTQGLTIKDDWHIAYFSSTFRGGKCVYMVHSAIEYIFM
jgi:hypothetical protein